MKHLVSVAIGVLSLFLVCCIARWMSPSQHLVSVDMARIKGQFIAQLAGHGASPETVAKASTRFKRALALVLARYAERTNSVLIDSTLILAGTHDATEELTVHLAKAMGGDV